MAIINPSQRAIKQYPADDRWMYWDGAVFRPYADVAEANTTIPANRRHKGLFVMIGSVLYWYKDGVTDADLKAFKIASVTRFKIGDGGLNTPIAGTTTYVNAEMIGMAENDYSVFRNGMMLFPGDDYANEPIAGGFELVISGDIFSTGETFLIK